LSMRQHGSLYESHQRIIPWRSAMLPTSMTGAGA